MTSHVFTILSRLPKLRSETYLAKQQMDALNYILPSESYLLGVQDNDLIFQQDGLMMLIAQYQTDHTFALGHDRYQSSYINQNF